MSGPRVDGDYAVVCLAFAAFPAGNSEQTGEEAHAIVVEHVEELLCMVN